MKSAEYISNQKLRLKMMDIEKEDFFKTLGFIKKCNGRYFDNNNKVWIVPADIDNKKLLTEAGFIIPDIIQEEIKPTIKNIKIKKEIEDKLFEFQKAGVKYIESRNGRCLIGDEMGLGKTIQAISYISLHPEFKKILIICPASLKLNWQNEIKKWINEDSSLIKLGIDYKRIQIINYDILGKWEEEIIKYNIDLVIADECHYVKNKKAKRTKSFLRIAKTSKHILALSGTPIVNRPVEFWNILNLLIPNIFESWWYFAQRYCDPKKNAFGWDFTGSTNAEELNKILKDNCMIRRTKKEVLKDLPDKIKSVIPFTINNREEYDYASLDFSGWLQSTENKKITVETLAKIEKLKQLSLKGKINSIIEWIENFLESGNKLVVMATHHITIDMLIQYFPNISVKLDGRDNQENKQKAIEMFQANNNIKLFLGNIKATGIGITLTSASNLCFCEFGWSPGEMSQAEDRIHRIGQKDSCNIYYFVGQDTIDEDIIDLLDSKQKTLDAVLDGKITKEESLLKNILNKFKGE